ncbi:lactate utilization protein B/C [Flavobacterium arcticum]|uniref:Lactate utilization protein B/C n=1 Tax=Flavobacterium arcticum TaxID=1784713 RepID=A0A345HE98_9FLAO|nr:LUD domain-containing protein [Flavobacterium arcticum]AXG74908.1 lactate utilization protein B/C [Flavobacterium arcticum]KAF2509594.1 lactate utilization protein B/C [Flavobacterium arcticum]
MSLFKKIFGGASDVTNEEKNLESSPFLPEEQTPTDEMFMSNFKKNGGKFLYCDNLTEVHEQFLNILEENDWFECEALCYEPKLCSLLDENKLVHNKPNNPKFILAGCENLVADEGSILLSSNQIKQNKPNELPANIVIFATTSQIVTTKSDGLRVIKHKYNKEYPTNITTIKYFEKVKDEDFLHYGSSAKNLYLLLLEDL